MRKLFTLAAAVLASVSMWATYAPTADEVIVLKDVYDASATEAGYSKHAAIAWGGTASTNSKKAGDPNNGGEETSSNVNCYSVKGNGKGKNITVSFEGCSQIIVYHEKHSSRYVELKDGSATGTLIGKGVANTYFTTVDLDANTAYSIFLHGTTGSDDQDFNVYAVKLIKGETCTDPEAHLTFTQSTAYVGDQFSYNYGSKNGGALTTTYTLDGAPAVEGTDYTFTSGNLTVKKAGQFVMHRTVDAQDGYCAVDVSDTIIIYEATAVESVTIEGPTAAYVGEAVTFTATAENASDYAWTVNGVDANTNAAEFTYTPAAAGEYSIVCSARNQFNADNEWIASEAKVLTASNVSGELIKAVHTGKTTATVTGLIGGTADKNTQSDAKLGGGHYFGIQLANGNFQEGDTLVVNIGNVSSSAGAVLIVYAEKEAENVILNTEVAGVSGDNKFVLPAAVNGKNALYIVRTDDNAWNAVVNSIAVIRPKAVKSTVEEFKGATINGDALNVSDFIELEGNQRVNVLETSYVEAPVVVFTKTVTTTYEDDSQTTKDVEVEVTAFNPADTERWQARTTINGVDYVVSCSKTASVVVTYMDGETVLGTENVAVNGSPAEYAQYQSKSLATFVGWYNNADLADEHAVADMSAEVIEEETTYYAKFENKYATSVNIEKLILDNSKDYDVKANALNGTNGYASNYSNEGMDITNDSLDTYEKKGAMRNYAYLGLKIKSKSLLNFRVAQGQTVLIKFGNVGTTPQVSINGGEYAAMTITKGVYSYTATGDDLLSMYVSEANKAVVLKQIMIGEAPALEDVVYDITCAETTNGTLSCNWAIALPGETVTLTVTPDEGYKVSAVTVNGEAIEPVESVYSFTMPASNVTVTATFVDDQATAVDNTNAAVKAVKVLRDGQLIIEKNGKTYNAFGQFVR